MRAGPRLSSSMDEGMDRLLINVPYFDADDGVASRFAPSECADIPPGAI